MSDPSARRQTCLACRQAALEPATSAREFFPCKKRVEVELLTMRCPNCGAEFTAGVQHDEILRRLAARKAHYGGLLLGEEILALRVRYGLGLRAAAQIFGTSEAAFSGYEDELTYPDDSVTGLLRSAIAMPASLKMLADREGVEVPLWQARCEDEGVSN